MPDREAVFLALFALTDGVSFDVNPGGTPNLKTFVTRTRRIALFTDVPSQNQPWFGQAEHNETSSQKTNLPYKREWTAKWVVYHRAADQPDVVPSTWNNQIVTALEEAMAPKLGDRGFLDKRNTLSGLVHHCFIDGEIFKDPGDIDNQAMIVVPIKILVP